MGNIAAANNFNVAVVQPKYTDHATPVRRFSKGSGKNTVWTLVRFDDKDGPIISAAAKLQTNNNYLEDDKIRAFEQRMAKSIEQNIAVNRMEQEELVRISQKRNENKELAQNISQEATKLSAEEKKALWGKLENVVNETTAKMLREALGVTAERTSKGTSIFSTTFGRFK